MSNTKVKRKMLRPKKWAGSTGWIALAEDAERDAAKARERCEQLTEAARIFRKNAESGMELPQSASQDSDQQHSV
jgi:hypothetical protein